LTRTVEVNGIVAMVDVESLLFRFGVASVALVLGIESLNAATFDEITSLKKKNN
jgi:hypothetical protein